MAVVATMTQYQRMGALVPCTTRPCRREACARFIRSWAPLKPVSADEAVRCVKSEDSVFVHGVSMTPQVLVAALARRAGPALQNVKCVSIHTEGPYEIASEASSVSFRPKCLFMGANVRQAVSDGRADYVPCFLSEIPAFFREKTIPIDVALVQVAPPDAHGYCSLGTSVDVAVAACEVAAVIVAQVNPRVPRTLGAGQLHVSRIAHAVEVDESIAHDMGQKLEPLHHQIGTNVASLVEDGATVQAGIGVVPDAALLALRGHKRLGV